MSDRMCRTPPSLSLDQLRVSFVPQHGGRFAFGLSVAFEEGVVMNRENNNEQRDVTYPGFPDA